MAVIYWGKTAASHYHLTTPTEEFEGLGYITTYKEILEGTEVGEVAIVSHASGMKSCWNWDSDDELSQLMNLYEFPFSQCFHIIF